MKCTTGTSDHLFSTTKAQAFKRMFVVAVANLALKLSVLTQRGSLKVVSLIVFLVGLRKFMKILHSVHITRRLRSFLRRDK